MNAERGLWSLSARTKQISDFFFFLNGEISDFYRAIKLMSQTTILREEYMIL